MFCFCFLMMLFLVKKCQLCDGEAIHEILKKTQIGQNMRTKWTTNDFWWEYENYDYLSTLLNNVSARKTIISFLWFLTCWITTCILSWKKCDSLVSVYANCCYCQRSFFQSGLSKEFVLINRSFSLVERMKKKTKKTWINSDGDTKMTVCMILFILLHERNHQAHVASTNSWKVEETWTQENHWTTTRQNEEIQSDTRYE